MTVQWTPRKIRNLNLLSFSMLWARTRILQISIPRNLFKASTSWDYVSNPEQLKSNWYNYNTWRKINIDLCVYLGVKIVYLSANSMGVSPGFRLCGSKYQTSQTTAQDVISCNRCLVNDCLQSMTCRISIASINNLRGRSNHRLQMADHGRKPKILHKLQLPIALPSFTNCPWRLPKNMPPQFTMVSPQPIFYNTRSTPSWSFLALFCSFLHVPRRRKKGRPGALKLPHTQGPGRGPTILVCCMQPYPIFYTRGCFCFQHLTRDLSVTWQQLYHCAKATPLHVPRQLINIVTFDTIIYILPILPLIIYYHISFISLYVINS